MITQILDTAIALAAVYLVLSTAASTMAEMLEVWLQRRGTMLSKGIAELFSSVTTAETGQSAGVQSAVVEFYNAPHIASLFGGTASEAENGGVTATKGRLPSYIPPDRFAAALLALTQSGDDAIQKVSDETQTLAKRLFKVATGRDTPATGSADAEGLRKLAFFFQESTDRISGWYRRHIRTVLFLIGLVLAGALNVDTIRIFRELSLNSSLREQIVSSTLKQIESSGLAQPPNSCSQPQTTSGQVDLKACEAQLKETMARNLSLASNLGIPMGWSDDPILTAPEKVVAEDLLAKAIGLALTVLAICLGGPFWFDLLNQLVNIRTSLKPAREEKEQGP